MTKDLRVVNVIATIMEDPNTIPMSVRHPTKEEKILQKEEAKEKNRHQERGGVEMIVMNEDPHGEARKEVVELVDERVLENFSKI